MLRSMRIALERVLKRFGELAVVDRVSLEIASGELFFLLGPSGCGKTSLLRCIAGFTTPEEGRILLGEVDVTHLPPHRRETGMVFQSYALWPHMTVRENLAFGLEIRKVSAAERSRRVDEVLELVRMTDRASHRPAQLSGGQQQRVALARALVVRPRCLLLDEPLSNLDAKLRLEMRVEIRRICKEAGLTAIYVTHDQVEALSIADRIAIMQQGRIEQCATPAELYRRPNSRFTAEFIGDANFLEGEVLSVEREGTQVRTSAGVILATSPSATPLPPGTRVFLLVRPEALRLVAKEPVISHALAATVMDAVFLGERSQHRLRIGADAHASTWTAVASPPRALLTPGTSIQACFDPADAVLLTR